MFLNALARFLQRRLQRQKMKAWKRRVSFGDLITDRWDNAKEYGFEHGTSMYDNVLVIGDVKVGWNTWIGPNVVLDGSGGLEIGNYCTICAGAQIYTHDSVKWARSGGREDYERSPTKIGSNVFIGPNAVVARGVTIGDGAAIGACCFVNKDVAPGATFTGQKPQDNRSWAEGVLM